MVVDVDGTLTDSGIYYDDAGNELKKFCTKDAAAFFAAKEAGIKTIVLTGRESPATTRRMKDLKVDFIFQKVKNKKEFLQEFMTSNNIKKEQIAYIGDDLNDLAPMSLVGYIGCPSDSCEEIKRIANYISKVPGGRGCVRDIIEHLFRAASIWEPLTLKVYNAGV